VESFRASIPLRFAVLIHLLLVNSVCLSDVVDAGNGHALVLDDSCRVWVMGRNDHGQLGLDEPPDYICIVPRIIPSLPKITAISRGYDHSMALAKDGSIYLWGRNNYGQIGYDLPNDMYVPQKLRTNKKFIDIAGGYWHCVALAVDSTVFTWGHNFYGELGSGNREHANFPQQVLAAGDVILRDIVSIASVGFHVLALDKNGKVWGWGENASYNLGIADLGFQTKAVEIKGMPGIERVSAGWHHSVALDSSGFVWVWGADPAVQYNVETRAYYKIPTRLEGVDSIKQIACGSWHTLAIDQKGEIWSWGRNVYGILGVNDTVNTSTPKKVPGISDAVAIGAGCFQSLVVVEGGALYTWGGNRFGQQGVGSRSRQMIPVKSLLSMDGTLDESRLEELNLGLSLPQQITVGGWQKNVMLVSSLLLNAFVIGFYVRRRVRNLK